MALNSVDWRDVAEELAEALEQVCRHDPIGDCPYNHEPEWERPEGCPEDCGAEDTGLLCSPMRCWLLWARQRVLLREAALRALICRQEAAGDRDEVR